MKYTVSVPQVHIDIVKSHTCTLNTNPTPIYIHTCTHVMICFVLTDVESRVSTVGEC